jgi:hypothetical protein
MTKQPRQQDRSTATISTKESRKAGKRSFAKKSKKGKKKSKGK